MTNEEAVDILETLACDLTNAISNQKDDNEFIREIRRRICAIDKAQDVLRRERCSA